MLTSPEASLPGCLGMAHQSRNLGATGMPACQSLTLTKTFSDS